MPHRLRVRRPGPLLAAVVVASLGLLGAGHLLADHKLVVRGVIHSASLSTFRVITSKSNVATDVTALGLKVGTAPDGEERIAFCRPVFVDPVSPLVNYTVLRASPENNPVSASYFVPTTFWDASTPPQLLFAQKSQSPAPVTTTYLATLFQNLLRRNNEPTGDLGVLLSGSADFRLQGNNDIYFLVELQIPFTVRVRSFAPLCPDPRTNPAPPAPQPIPDFLMFWTSSRSGVASIVVNQRPISSLPIRVTGQKVAETRLPRQVLLRGGNEVVLSVLPDDIESTELPVTASVTLTIPDVICPFDPQRPPRGP